MSVTAQLLKVFRVEQQLRGLKSRLNVAEKFLAEQTKQLQQIEATHAKLSAELKHLKTTVAGEEGETTAIDQRVATLRERMNASKTNKEYSAHLAELNALKIKKEEIEKAEMGQIERIEALKKLVEEQATLKAERASIIAKATKDRDERAAEIKDRVSELQAQRDNLAKDVTPEALRVLEEMTGKKGDEAMSPVEVVDRRAHEWSCGSCMMTLPVETVNSITVGRLTRCGFCKVVLYSEEDLVTRSAPKPEKPAKNGAKRASKAKAAKGADQPEAE
jgi:predicted  nucleic acid-binding Zn-ribbon protein